MVAVADLVSLEVQTPIEGVFVLNRSVLNGPDVLATGTSEGLEWTPVLCDATGVRVRRGGTRDGVSTSIEVGTLNATFVNGVDPTQDPNWRPGVGVRQVARRAAALGSVQERYAFPDGLDGFSITGGGTATVTDGALTLAGSVTTSRSVWDTPPLGAAVRMTPGQQAGLYVRYADHADNTSVAVQLWSGNTLELTHYPPEGHNSVVTEIPYDPTAHAEIAAYLHEGRAVFAARARGAKTWTILLDAPARPITPSLTRIDCHSVIGTALFEDLRIFTPGDVTLFTGTTSDFGVTYDKMTDNTFTTLSGVDSVQALANTMRHGAANPVQEFEPWERRAERLLQSSPVPFVGPVRPENAVVASWTGSQGNWASAWVEANLWGATEVSSPNAADPPFAIVLVRASDAPTNPARGTRVVSGLIPGQTYRVTFNMALTDTSTEYGVVGIGTSVHVPDAIEGWFTGRLSYDFRATSATHTLVCRPAAGATSTMRARISDWNVTPLTSVNAANTVYESSLANHLDLVANTAQVGWYVDSDGLVCFSSSLGFQPTPLVHFSDVHDTDDVLHVCYTRADVTYDTRGLVNDLTLENHARRWDADQGAWAADDRNLGPFQDEVSGATWGRRSASLPTSVADVPGTIYADSTKRLAESILETYAEPRIVIRRVTFNGEAYPEFASSLEIYDPVSVTHQGATRHSLIVGIEHDIKVDGWFVTVDLMEGS